MNLRTLTDVELVERVTEALHKDKARPSPLRADILGWLDELHHRLLAPGAAPSTHPARARTGEDESAGAAHAASDAMPRCTCAGVVPWHETGCPRAEQWTPEHAADAFVSSAAKCWRCDGRRVLCPESDGTLTACLAGGSGCGRAVPCDQCAPVLGGAT